MAGQYLLQIDAACPGSFGDGPVAVLRGLGNEPELYCYVFDFRDAPQLVLWIPGEGQTLRFDKVN